MKFFIQIFIIGLVLSSIAYGQDHTPESLGFRHIVFQYKQDRVDILVKSKKGEEKLSKPIFFFCQGSLPIPLIKYDGKDVYGVFPFNPDSLSKKYHLVIIGKPSIPLVADIKNLAPNYTFNDTSGKFPRGYSNNNLLSYYVDRNISLLSYLQKQSWVSSTSLVVAGHSEGSTVAVKMATHYKKITHLIYAGGNPLGRIMSMIQQGRTEGKNTDSTTFCEVEFDYWKTVVADKKSMDASKGDTYKATYEFSEPILNDLLKLTIPVMVVYGTKDWSAPFNDYLRVEAIRHKKGNFSFKAYIGCDHNFFPLDTNSNPNYNIFNWNNVMMDWVKWLNKDSSSIVSGLSSRKNP